MLGLGGAGLPRAQLLVRTEKPWSCIVDSVAPFPVVAERRVLEVAPCHIATSRYEIS